MNQQSGSTISIERSGAHSGSETRLHGVWLVLARAVWVVIVLLALGLFVASIPIYFAYLHSLTTTPNSAGPQLNHSEIQALHNLGLSLDFYASYSVVINILLVLGYLVVGGVIFWRKSRDRMALFASFSLVLLSLAFNSSMLVLLPSPWLLLANGILFMSNICIALFFYIFPDGRFIPRWTSWLMAVNILYWFVNSFFPSSPIIQSWPGFFLFAALIVSFAGAQVYRYRRVSTPAQRQQTKWVVFGIAVGLGGGIALIVVMFVLLAPLITWGPLAIMFFNTALTILSLSIPFFIGMAILRSRLWDIDVIINRTLVYGTLTGTLALLYFGLIFALQFLFQGIFYQNNAVAIVVSTLAIAALFHPLRRRIQAMIDRRFYRRKYDAARTLAAFSATLRNEVDLATLSEQVIAIVQETMQPAHVSLWLRPPAHPGTHQALWRATRADPSEKER